MDEHNEQEPEKRIDLNSELGMTRRDLMRRSAIVGGALLWVAPAIQSMKTPAMAQVSATGSENYACCWCISPGSPTGDDITSDGGPDSDPLLPRYESAAKCEAYSKDTLGANYVSFEFHAGPNPIIAHPFDGCVETVPV